MMSRTERNAFLRRYHYRWKEVKGTWILLGPDGWRVTELEAEQNIEQLQSPVLSPQAWALDVIEQRPLVLDTETTGLDLGTDEIIDLALVELDGTVVLNTLIRCQKPVPADATQVHGITNDMLRDQPSFPEVWEQLAPHLSRPLVIYNASYDVPMLAYGAWRYKIRMARPHAHCLMIRYTEYCAAPEGSYQKLDAARERFGIDTDTHRALTDAQATRQILLSLARET